MQKGLQGSLQTDHTKSQEKKYLEIKLATPSQPSGENKLMFMHN